MIFFIFNYKMSNEEEIPLMENEEKDDDDDDGTTNPFQPGGRSTPGPSGEDIQLMTLNRGKEKGPAFAETILSLREIFQEGIQIM